MDVVLSTVIIAFLIGILILIRKSKAGGNQRPDQGRSIPVKQKTAFHAVSIVYATSACEAAKNMDGRRFLSGAAPHIPLAECDVLECKCRFVHHKDRRKGDDRRNPYINQFGSGETGTHQEEQRKRRERREEPPESL